MAITRKVANQLPGNPKCTLAVTLDDVKADTNQSDKNMANQLPRNPKCTLTPSLLMSSRQTPTNVITISQRDHHTWLTIPVGIIRKVPNQLLGNPKCTLTPSLVMLSRQIPTKAIKISQRNNHTLLSDPNGNHPQGRKPVSCLGTQNAP